MKVCKEWARETAWIIYLSVPMSSSICLFPRDNLWSVRLFRFKFVHLMTFFNLMKQKIILKEGKWRRKDKIYDFIYYIFISIKKFRIELKF